MKNNFLFILFWILSNSHTFALPTINANNFDEWGIPVTIAEFDSLVKYYASQDTSIFVYQDYRTIGMIGNTLEAYKILRIWHKLSQTDLYETFLSKYAEQLYQKVYEKMRDKNHFRKLSYRHKGHYDEQYWAVIDSVANYIPNRKLQGIVSTENFILFGAYPFMNTCSLYKISFSTSIPDSYFSRSNLNCNNFDKYGLQISHLKFAQLVLKYNNLTKLQVDTLRDAQMYVVIRIANTLEAYSVFDFCRGLIESEKNFLTNYYALYYDIFIKRISNDSKFSAWTDDCYCKVQRNYPRLLQAKVINILKNISDRKNFHLTVFFITQKEWMETKKRKNFTKKSDGMSFYGVYPDEYIHNIYKIR